MAAQVSEAYRRIEQLLASDRCVVLDGGVATEIERVAPRELRVSDKDGLWGLGALYHAPYAVLEIHRRYVTAGCDLISTNTWSILNAPGLEMRSPTGRTGLSHWMDAARLGIRLARQATEQAGQAGRCAVAFSLNGDVDSPQKHGTLELLARVFGDDPPDLILMETLSLVRENLTLPAVEIMLKTGLPVWLSFRRCRHGVCGVYGQHWGGPEGDHFGRMARKFEEMGVGALLINCLPVSHVPGMLPWLRDFTDLPLGVYPNLGRYLDPGWKTDERVGPEEYASLAIEWRAEGAQIIGGCCGVGPDHIASAARSLEETRPGISRERRADAHALLGLASSPETTRRSPVPQPWTDEKARVLYPMPFPKIVCDPGVFHPTQGSFLVWKHLFRTGEGNGKRCLDVGCGTGVLAIQMALNGASSVEAIDIQPEAVANTMTNAFRNGVADRVQGKTIDFFAFVPNTPYDLVVASLYQMPVDPMGQLSSHRPIDYWGRNQIDHLLALLPSLLTEYGHALVMQISILGQMRTEEILDAHALQARVIDFSFFPFSPVFLENLAQIRRVEQISDAYHLNFGDHDVMVMYLLEVTRRQSTHS
ncbi:MAG: homocysteine S-methyltransferase family protein [Planctomycetes bacterium]|nr:homocysteine S-methyltransferase family protein [Planctomycetota bacterium]